MKTLLSIALSFVFVSSIATSAFSQCSHGYVEADLSSLKIAADEQKPEEAMSTFDPAKVDGLLEVKNPTKEVKTSE